MKLRRPPWTATLTWKAAVFITLMCCALTAMLGALVHVGVTSQTVENAREEALDKLLDTTRLYEAGHWPRAAIDPPGLPSSLRELALTGRHGTMVADHDGHPNMWAAGPAVGKHVVAVAMDHTQSAKAVSGLKRAIVYSSVLATGATVLVGTFAVSRVTRRLHQAATVARRISAGDLDARVNSPRTKPLLRSQDEVAAVTDALNTMACSLQSKLEGERRFTADVAHELRTPLTGLSTAAELLTPGRPTDLVRDRVQAMCSLTEELLEISRLDTNTEELDLDMHGLGQLAQRVIRVSGTETDLRVVEDAWVMTDRRRLERVLGNLVSNAHKHGCAPVMLTVEGPEISVRDHGDGYPDYLLTHGPQRFRTEGGATGHGLGLTIAVGQARALGATLEFTNAPDSGALARLRL